MSRVEQSTIVHCPFDAGLSHIGNFFRMYESADGRVAKISLHVTAAIAGLEKPLSTHRSAIATLVPPPETIGTDACYRVHWEPEVPGPYPLFTGELFVEPAGRRESLSLRLRGVYTPPLAFLGDGGDVIGNTLAIATANQLLLQISEFIERDVRIERTRKKQVRHAPYGFDQPALD